MTKENSSHKQDSRKKSSSSQHYNSRRPAFQWGFVDDDDTPLPEEPSPASRRKTAQKKKATAKSPSEPVKAAPVRKKTVPKTAAPNIAKSSPGSKFESRPERKKSPAKPSSPSFFDNEDDDLTLPSYGRTTLEFFEDEPDDEPEYVPPKSSTRTAKSGKHSKEPKKAPREERRDSGVPQFERPRPDKLMRARKVWDPATREYVPLEKARPELIPTELRELASAKEPAKTPVKKSPQPKMPKEKRPVEKTEPSEPAELTKKQPLRKKAKTTKTTVSEKVQAGPPEKPREKTLGKPAEKPVEKPAAKRTEQSLRERKEPIEQRDSKEPKSQKRSPVKETPPEIRTKKSPAPRGVVSHSKNGGISELSDLESPRKTFGKVPLSETMLKAVQLARYLEPTPIQEGVIPKALSGIDLMGQARTGTGKTAAFLIPLIERIEECEPGKNPVALILVPTRELAVQVRDEARKLSHGRDIRTTACYGGNPIAKQLIRLREGVDIVVGTPGRILDLMKRGALHFEDLHWVVLDEADRMLDIGFRPDIEKILRQTPPERQTLLFSATLPQPVVRLAERYMRNPEIMDFSDSGIDVDTIEQYYITVDPERKFDALVYLLHQENPNQAIIFCRTKRGADRVARMLGTHFKNMATIHGDLAQSVRDSVMARFRAGTLKMLVATDIVGRGIDVSGISHIINYDVPGFCDDYVHRVGRTGRMGREGVAYTFVTIQEGAELTRIEMRINKLLKRAELKGFEAFSKPTDPGTEETASESKPVFGKPVRRIRRAL